MKLIELASSPIRNSVDIHVHTTFSDGQNDMETMVCEAIRKGLSGIAFTDHVWRSSGWVEDYAKEKDRLQKRYPDLLILLGLEGKAVNRRGDLDLTEKQARLVDFVMGVVHRYLPDDESITDIATLSPKEALEVETEILLAVIRNPIVGFLGHPYRTFYKFQVKTGRAEHNDRTMKVLYEKLASESMKFGKPIEYNCRVPHRETLLEVLREKACPFLAGSDAHAPCELGKMNAELGSI